MSTETALMLGALGLWGLGSYPRVPAMGGPLTRQLQPLVNGALCIVALAGVLAVAGIVSGRVQSGIVVAVTAAATAAGVVRAVRVACAPPLRVVVIGDIMETRRWVGRWHERSDVCVVGAVLIEPDTDAETLPTELLGVPTVTSLKGLASRVGSLAADMVALAPSPGLTPSTARRISWSLQDTGVAVGVVGLFEAVAPRRISAGLIGGETLCEIVSPRPAAVASASKHAMDRVVAALLLVALAPLIALLAAVILLDSPGPPIFRQTRIGRHGKPFTLYKMRTMRVDAERTKHELADVNDCDGVLFKMHQDPRVTRFGKILRRSSLDELPQLVNVLRGEMSLVGPRPFLPTETAELRADALRRTVMKPGITGLWQVSGRSDLDWDSSIALDLHYVENWTLGGDAGIALRTVRAVLGAKGAY